jgi:hypothetical protein
MSRIEEVNSDLCDNLLPCAGCGKQPHFYRIRGRVAIFCGTCGNKFLDGRSRYPNPSEWHKSLYEAVAVWQTTAKILGSRERREESMSEHFARKLDEFQEAVIDDVIEGFDPT